MIDEQEIQDDPQLPQPLPPRKFPWGMMAVAATFVVVAFLSWYGSWFGRPLSDAKIGEYLNDREKPRNVQHALSQIADRIIKGDQSVSQWYPAVIASAENPSPEVRRTAAWTMGQDSSNQEFHQTLLTLLRDGDPGVRHNAALQLVRFGDGSGRAELVTMLEPYSIKAETAGVAEAIIEEEGIAVAHGSPLTRIKQDDGRVMEIRAPDDGRVDTVVATDGASVQTGDELVVLSPSVVQVENVLVALALVGRTEDVAAIERYTRPLPGMPDHIREMASRAIREINRRSSTTMPA
ncbi:MAG TPA: HEAT repeat domain-containing protein [Blastocatellia bacterium]|nr:HEAT repeat domain-containing protein [Blastocatellia bacterium]